MSKEEIKTRPEDLAEMERWRDEYLKLHQFALDRSVLKKIMSGQLPDFKELPKYEQAALYRLSVVSAQLDEAESDFLAQIGAGKVPPLISGERDAFNKHLRETGLV